MSHLHATMPVAAPAKEADAEPDDVVVRDDG